MNDDQYAGQWKRLAACRDEDAEVFFHPDGERGTARRRRAAAAKTICRSCPVRAECLTFAVDTRQNHGTWGGLAEDERKAMRTRPSSAITTIGGVTPKDVREWAATAGVECAAMGRVPRSVVDLYVAAQTARA